MMMAVMTCSSAAAAAVLPLCKPGPSIPAGQGVQSCRQARLQQPLLSWTSCACSHTWPLVPCRQGRHPRPEVDGGSLAAAQQPSGRRAAAGADPGDGPGGVSAGAQGGRCPVAGDADGCVTASLPIIGDLTACWAVRDGSNTRATAGPHICVCTAGLAPLIWLPLCATIEAPAYITAAPLLNAPFSRCYKAVVKHPCSLRLVFQAASADLAGVLMPCILGLSSSPQLQGQTNKMVPCRSCGWRSRLPLQTWTGGFGTGPRVPRGGCGRPWAPTGSPCACRAISLSHTRGTCRAASRQHPTWEVCWRQ